MRGRCLRKAIDRSKCMELCLPGDVLDEKRCCICLNFTLSSYLSAARQRGVPDKASSLHKVHVKSLATKQQRCRVDGCTKIPISASNASANALHGDFLQRQAHRTHSTCKPSLVRFHTLAPRSSMLQTSWGENKSWLYSAARKA